ncbi:LPXTG cell wall anchor domain-containing protein [Streptomyces sp. JH14]|uniref:LPXTG cell wall anchor domain-containing protein n=1 Tax=Streptomyces sp. JH14 TaxID=2793630 RepID=UPI0023F71E04|nr:LPXTG cell wall anchor domain-containing protein [Streptomyces sp. JH14]MDF6042651.1 LPXTG cell wall anchor domain-containing protein [Streptomyces sp. JH14]
MASTPPAPARPRHGIALGLAVASVVPAVLGGPTAAAAATVPALSVTADQQPACGSPDSDDFPIVTRIHGGPQEYTPGGGYGTWLLDLTNTTSESCRSIHPVLVLVDEDRRLTSDQIQLEFSEQAQPDVQHRVSWETTDRDEHIGVFGGGEGEDAFEGFTVPAGRTVTVRVRMAFTSDTGPSRITATAAIVQRHRAVSADGKTKPEDDGDWVGESDDYAFNVVEDDGDTGDIGDTGDTGEVGDTGDTSGTGESTDVGGAGDVAGSGDRGRDTAPDGTGDSPTGAVGGIDGTRDTDGTGAIGGTGDTDAIGGVDGLGNVGGTQNPPASGRVPGADPAPQDLPELAETGRTSTNPWPALATAAALLLGGAALLAWSRRLRRAAR